MRPRESPTARCKPASCDYVRLLRLRCAPLRTPPDSAQEAPLGKTAVCSRSRIYGYVSNVVFPAGGYVYDGNLYVSYGAADRCVALATAPLEELLAELKKHPV